MIGGPPAAAAFFISASACFCLRACSATFASSCFSLSLRKRISAAVSSACDEEGWAERAASAQAATVPLRLIFIGCPVKFLGQAVPPPDDSRVTGRLWQRLSRAKKQLKHGLWQSCHRRRV